MALTADDKDFIVRALAAQLSVFSVTSISEFERQIRKSMAAAAPEQPPEGHIFIVGQINPVDLRTPSDMSRCDKASVVEYVKP